MGKTTRRDFIRLAGVGVAAVSLSPVLEGSTKSRHEKNEKEHKRLKLGMASYTFRKFNLEDTLAMTKRLGLETIAFKSFHLALESTGEKIKAVAEKVKAAGLELYGCSVVYMQNEEEVYRTFNYAKAAGMKVIIGVPNHELLDLVNKKVQEFDIQLAIHNHGPGDKLYPTPESAYQKIKNLDPRIGLCLDIGHTQRSGIDPSDSAEKFADRLLDVHIKDVTAASKEGRPVEVGRGVIDIPKFLRTLLKLDYKGIVSLEYEKDADDPLPGAAESLGYVKGVLSVI
ncbi:MAG: sugar phosphate isomerase/epimerase [Candidatus Aminicenantes bacterium]|nr:sugar phosphate isomerase/epimerase [Candidatus Aminicenantes bacterium]MBL7082163.1 sugar phosphate isomerase/epimerase [Candidatus Aminicenantes bacterium]